jgi:hypothetical protein
MAAPKCPNYSAPEWKQLTDLLEETGLSRFAQKKSHRMFMRYENLDDPLSKAIRQFDPNIHSPSQKHDTLTINAAKYDENKVDHKYYNKAGEEYTSVSRILDSYEETKYRGEDTGSLYADSGTKIHSAFEDYARGTSVENIKESFRQNNIPLEFIPHVTAFIDGLKKTGIVLVENILAEDSLKIAGKPDIIHIKFDGSIDIYDFKTAYQTPKKRQQGAAVWNPTGDYDGYKSRRYTVQTEVYGRMVERTLGQPVTNYFIVPIEVEFAEDNPTREMTKLTMLDKENVTKYGYTKSGIISDKIFGEKPRQPVASIEGIDDSTELVERLTGIVQYVQENLDNEAERILSLPQFHRFHNGVLYYIKNGKQVRLNDQSNRTAQKQQIIDEYLKQKYSSYKDIPNSIMNYLTTGDEAFLNLDGKPGDSMRAILKPFMKREDINVYALSDVKGFESKKNWIVITTGNVSSLLYVGNEELEMKFRTTTQSGFISKGINGFSESLFANIGIDAATASYELNSRLSNNIADARRLEAGFIAMKLKEGNPDMVFDRILIHSVNKKTTTPYATDLREIIPIIQRMSTHNVASKFIPKNVLSLLSNPKVFDIKSYQPNFSKVYLDNFDSLAFSRDFNIKRGIEAYAQEQIDKESLLALIQGRIQATLRRAEEDSNALEESRMLSEMYYQLKGISTEVKPLSLMDSKGSVPMNVANPVIQDLVKTYKAALASLRSDFWQDYKKPFNDRLEKFFNASGNFFSEVNDRTLSQTTRYYESLFERDVFKVQNVDGSVSTKELNNFSLIEEGSDKFNTLHPHQQEMIVYINDKIQKAADKMGIKWQRGKLPLVRASFYNKFYRQGQDGERTSYKDLLARMFEDMEENFGSGEKTNQKEQFRIENRFQSQENIDTYDGRTNIMGIDSSGFVNLEEYNEWETNLEVVLDLFTMEAARMEHMNRVAGDFNAAESLFKWQKSALFEERIGLNVDWIQWWRTSQLFNKDIDSGSLSSKFVNTFNKAASIGLIAAKPGVAVLNLLAQQVSAFSQATANSFTGNKDYSLTDWSKAGVTISNPKNYEKINLLLQDFGLYNLSMSDLINGHRRYGNKSIFRMKYLYSLLNAGDWYSRSQLLVAQMMHDGTWDAYSVENGVLKYDEKADGRFNGEKLTPEKGKALNDALRYQMAKDGLLPTGNSGAPLPKAYDSNLAARIKGQADSVIGGFDRDARGLYSFHSWGKLLGLFKTWLPSRLNKGFSSSYTSEIMGNYEFTRTDDNSMMAVWKGEQMEGMLNTLLYYGWYLAKYRKSPDKLTDVQRSNLRRLTADVALIASAFLLAGLLDDEDDKTALAIRRSVDDILATYNMFTVFDFLYTPVAVVYAQQTLEQIWSLASKGTDASDKTIEALISKVPVANTMQELYDAVDSIDE